MVFQARSTGALYVALEAATGGSAVKLEIGTDDNRYTRLVDGIGQLIATVVCALGGGGGG